MVLATPLLLEVSIEYDNKYQSCTINLPQCLNKQFSSLEELLEAVKTVSSFDCSSSLFKLYYPRPYADSLKYKEYIFKDIQLQVNEINLDLINKGLIVFNCCVKQKKEIQTFIYLRIVEVKNE